MKEDLNKNEFDYQGKTEKQYGDSAKIVFNSSPRIIYTNGILSIV